MIFLFLIIFIFLFLFFYFISEKRFKNAFKSLSYDLMDKNNQSFLNLAKIYFEKHQKIANENIEQKSSDLEKMILSIDDSLKRLDENTSKIEKDRVSSFSSLKKQIETLIHSENLLKKETYNLVHALKSPNIKGSWGQIHLKRVLEISGMLNKCDFLEQPTLFSDEKIYRPDIVVKLPEGKNIVIDAKTPTSYYLEAIEEDDEEKRKEKFKMHAKTIKKYIKELSSKQYFKHISSIEYVILFLPQESFLSAALSEEPDILEIGSKDNVILATPTTLIAILKAIYYFWKNEDISKNAEKISKCGKELYERIALMSGHLQKLGDHLKNSIDCYNKTIFAMESKVITSAKQLKEYGITSDKNISLKEINI